MKLEAASVQQHSPSDETDPFSDSDRHTEEVGAGDTTEDYSPSHETDNDHADSSGPYLGLLQLRLCKIFEIDIL